MADVEICNLAGSEMALPIDLVNQVEIFNQVLSINTWRDVLSNEDRKYLEKFLPKLPTDNPNAQEVNLRALFGGENFKFGNPLQQFHSHLKDGFFYPDVVKYKKLCQKAKYKEYRLQQQQFYRNLLQEVMLSRQEILDQVSRQGPSDPIRTRGKVVSDEGSYVEHKVKQKMDKILNECRKENEDVIMSSEDEDSQMTNGKGFPVPGYRVPCVLSPPGFHSVVAPIPGMPYGYPSLPHTSPLSCLQIASPSMVTESDFQKMLQRHKKKRMLGENIPELDTRFMSLQDIVQRTNPTKKATRTYNPKNKPRLPMQVDLKKKDKKAKLKKKLKQKLQQKQERQASAKKQEIKQNTMSEPVPLSDLPPAPSGKLSCFFSLLREVFYTLQDLKGTLQKIEEQVRSWQASYSFTSSPWSAQQEDWVKLVYSSLMYLSGSSGVTASAFVPLVDFKERPQQWKWIGAFRDSDEELVNLCQDWLQVKDQLSIKKTTSEGGSSVNAPEARVKTDYVVRPSTNSEREIFRAQEAKRYINPHLAYTFVMHGFESIVGPVKGVFSKETNLNKAREHSLLISNRPPFVTILTLVRDAAARLPNGEGTRAEVCELLKDSQFLNMDATDAQIHTVVSGALDRLHYEKDPCVKYDSNRKVWIYLHRNRTEEEFEKIHQANAAAARAKKLQKPRVPRQPKQAKEETSSPPVAEAIDPSAAIASVASPSASLDTNKPTIKLKFAGNFSPSSTGHPKVSVITAVGQGSKLDKIPKGSLITATIQGGTVIMSPKQKTATKPSTSDAGSPIALKHASALNSHASPLNSASFSPVQAQAIGDEPAVRRSGGSESDISSSSENGSGSGSSSEDEGAWGEAQSGGKSTTAALKYSQHVSQINKGENTRVPITGKFQRGGPRMNSGSDDGN
ncbi:nuclear factor related to kappa-B-binding protein isoform X3 [Nematostella vectensis]|uniref:nuclear factor related to kappa-B-binding protein isoform X3 n=1 Tax=Nematostella vectensis TaxID=45351 RepID=UPI0020779A34|nr:nuclear factor related to kappa-B-binding protein isoform X3 [Nematostella vectensis]